MKIKHKFILSTIVLFITLLSICMTILIGYRYVTGQASLTNDFNKESMYLHMMMRGVSEAIINEGAAISINMIKEGGDGFNAIHTRLLSDIEYSGVHAVLTDKIAPQWQTIQNNMKSFINSSQGANPEEMLIPAAKFINNSDSLLADIKMLSEKTRAIVNANSRISVIIQKIIVIISVLFLIIFSLTAHHIYNSITRPIQELNEIAEGFSHGDLTITMDESRQDEFGTLAVHFNDSTAKLKQINQELQDFAHIASHDLQEPLRKIQAFGDRLKMQYSDALGEKGGDYIDRIQKAAKRMQKLTNGLLMYSRIASKARPYEPVDLAQVVSNVVSDYEMQVRRTGGAVEIGNLSIVDADTGQMKQLVQHLLDNALKYARDNVPPEVKINGGEIGPNGHDAYRINSTQVYQMTVEDNGMGFEQKYSERIFGVFQRLHGKNNYEGAGIGLSICRRIVERHNGNITAKGIPGKGAKFIITLPIKQNGGGNNG